MSLPAKIYRTGGKFIRAVAKILWDCCCASKFCYYLWEWDCPSQTYSLVDAQCLADPPEEGTETWFWDGTHWQIWMTGAACADAGDCDSPVEPFPSGPSDVLGGHPCPHWTYPRDCDNNVATFGMPSSEAGMISGLDWWRYAGACYRFFGGVGTFVEPALVIHPGDITMRPSCEECPDAPPPPPCADTHCVHIQIFDDTDTLIDDFDATDDLDPGGCVYYRDDLSPSLAYNPDTGQWDIFSAAAGFSDFGFSTADSSSIYYDTYSEDVSPGTHPPGYYAVLTPC